MTLRARLRRLEKAAGRVAPADRPDRMTEEDWLECFEVWGREGVFAVEPDFPRALAFYRDALGRAKAQADPPFDPPADFMPHLADLPEARLFNWWTRERFPDVQAGWWWLAEMHERLCGGVPPVTEAEFHYLADWFHGNDERLYRLSMPSQVLDLGNGRRTTTANIRYGLAKGPRAVRAGELAEDLRRLRALCGKGGV